jgi:ABC-type glycerol-3-phosphate transport system substrate-binding protein
LRPTHLAALAAAAALTLAACGGSDDSGSETSDPATSAATSAAPEPTESTGAPAAEQTQLKVDETIQDDAMGDTVKITGVVRDFPATSNTAIAEGGGEWVLVEIDGTSGEKYSGGLSGVFSLYTPDGTLAGASTSIIDADMEAAGFTPFESPDAGEQATGWQAFQVNTRADAYQVQYKRLGANVIGSDKTIPTKVWKIDLPTT